jgi:nicotinate-nucleotide adenylyltransferase
MVRLAAEDNPAFEVCTIEVNAVGPSYTVETLKRIRAKNGDAELFFIVGLDAFQDMPNWKEPERSLSWR